MPSHCSFALQPHTEPVSPERGGRADGERSGSHPAEHDRRGRCRQREPLALEAGLGRKNGWYEEAGDKSRLIRSERFLPLWQAPLSSPKGCSRGFGGCGALWPLRFPAQGCIPRPGSERLFLTAVGRGGSRVAAAGPSTPHPGEVCVKVSHERRMPGEQD